MCVWRRGPFLVLVVALAAIIPVAACGRGRATDDAAGTSAVLGRFSIPGAANSAASIAARGRHVVLTWAATTGDRTDAFAAVSDDAGATFSTPSRINDVDGDVRAGGEQPPRVAIADDVVVVWSSRLTGQSRVRAARSSDGARTFSPAVTLHDPALTGARGWSSVAIDANGVVHTVWLDGRNAHASAHSSAAAGSAGAHSMHGGAAPMRQDIFQAAWRPGSAPIESPIAQNVCFCCKTAVATGPDATTYVAWRHIFPTSLRDIAVASSRDGGRTFSDPARVSEDGWHFEGCPEDGPSAVVDSNNVLHVVWPTILQDGSGRKAIFYSSSSDHGRTFSPRMRVDDGAKDVTPSHAQIALAGDRRVVAWDELSGGVRSVKLRTIGREAGSIVTLRTSGAGSYPAVAVSEGSAPVAFHTTSGAESAIELQRAAVPR